MAKFIRIKNHLPNRQNDSTTFNSEDDAKRAFARVIAELRGIETFILED